MIDRYRPLFLKLLTVVVLGISLAYVGISWFVADRLTRPERYPLTSTPGELGLTYESVEFKSTEDGLTLRGWWIPSQDSDRAIILVHGRSSNRAGFDPRQGTVGGLLLQANGIVRRGYSVLSFDLRGHGESDGVRYSLGPRERRDVRGAIAYVQSRGIPASRIGLLCHSMGAATCLLAAAEEPDLAGVVADSGYARLTDLLAVELPEATGLPGLFNPSILLIAKLVYGVDVADASPIEVVSRVVPPILFIHSENDAIIPVEHSRSLWSASGQEQGTLWIVDGPEHDRIFESDPDRYYERVLGFLDRAMK